MTGLERILELQEEHKQIKKMLGLKGLTQDQIYDLFEQAKTHALFRKIKRYALNNVPLGKEFVKNWEI